jgi:phosphoserine phosphatase RsbU/P
LANRKGATGVVSLVSQDSCGGPPLGCFEGSVYGTTTAKFQEGDLFLLYSDGLFEVFSPEGNQYGHERLLESLNKRCLLSTETIFDEVLEDLTLYNGGKGFDDDICLVGLEVFRKRAGS